jgi:pimeloyl-ACP methyl ester carboxylesterase
MILILSISSTLIAIPAAVAALVALLVLSGFLYQWIGGLVDRKRLQAPGRLVDIGDGRKLYLVEKGPAGQGPSVVFESGFAATSLNWLHIQDAVAEHLHTVAYDRCGLGWSSAPVSDRTPTQVAAELRATLLAAGIQPPYILVGHSFGGLVMQRFALDYPAETAGVLLLDPMRTDEWPPVNAARLATVTRAQRLTRIGLHCSRIGITRLAVRSHLCRSAKFSGFLIRRAGSKGEYLAGRLHSEIGKMPPQVRPSIAAHWSRRAFIAASSLISTRFTLPSSRCTKPNPSAKLRLSLSLPAIPRHWEPQQIRPAQSRDVRRAQPSLGPSRRSGTGHPHHPRDGQRSRLSDPETSRRRTLHRPLATARFGYFCFGNGGYPPGGPVFCRLESYW